MEGQDVTWSGITGPAWLKSQQADLWGFLLPFSQLWVVGYQFQIRRAQECHS